MEQNNSQLDVDDFFKPGDEIDEPPPMLEYPDKRDGRFRRLLVISLLLIASALIGLLATLVLLKALSSTEPSESNRIYRKPNQALAVKTERKNIVKPVENKVEGTVKTSPPIKQVMNLIVIGADEAGVRKKARGLIFAKIDTISGSIQAINIPEKTYLNITGLGLDQISESFTVGMDTTKRAVEDLLHMRADGHIVVRHGDFESMISENRFQVAFERAVESSFTEDEKRAYSEEIATFSRSNITISQLPVKYISISGKPYYEPNYDEISKLLESVWGIKVEIKNETVRVIVLNGSGVPGAGRLVAERIKPAGFLIADVENASSFNYEKTRIIAYKENYMDKAKVVQQILGVGEVIHHAVDSQDVAEMAIIVGKDYRSID